MKKIFYLGILFFTVACNSAGSSINFVDTTTTNIEKGNSPGSNVIEMDTTHMDTSSNGKSGNGSNH